MTTDGILKVYPAKYWNDSVVIIGNKAGLIELKKVIEQAMVDESAQSTVVEADAKQYVLVCKMFDGDLLDPTWASLPAHYEVEDLSEEEYANLDEFMNKYEKSEL